MVNNYPQITQALAENEELLTFFNDELLKRDDLELLFSQISTTKPETILQIIAQIKNIEDTEDEEEKFANSKLHLVK